MTNPTKTRWAGKPDPLSDAMAELARRHRLGDDVREEFYDLVLPIAKRAARVRASRLARMGVTVDEAAREAAVEIWKTWVHSPGDKPAATAQRAASHGMHVVEAHALGMGRAKYETLLREGRDPLNLKRQWDADAADRLTAHTAVVDLGGDPCERLERKEQRELDHAVLADMTAQAGLSPDVLAAALAGELKGVQMKKFLRAVGKAAQTDDREVQRVECTEPPGRDVQGSLWTDDAAVAPPIVGGQPQADEDEEGQTLGV